MTLRQLKITAPTGFGRPATVELDGEPIGQDLRGVDLRIDADEIVTATLHLLHVASEFNGQAAVTLPEETQALLKRLGWTPPAEDGG
ncbi:MAG TPA: hypothetical protein VG276_27900 [Actinomycetes bacterium]|jgi:hypothetical protein|nr:hypothetical protein [Actinomycetes bacterium]